MYFAAFHLLWEGGGLAIGWDQRVLNDLWRTRLFRRRMIWLLAHPHLSCQQDAALSQSSCVSPVELTDGRGGRGERGAKSYDSEKAWSSINHTILSGRDVQPALIIFL
jgi:hypothetical protein